MMRRRSRLAAPRRCVLYDKCSVAALSGERSAYLHKTLKACPGRTVVWIQVLDERAEPGIGDLIVCEVFIALVAANVRVRTRLTMERTHYNCLILETRTRSNSVWDHRPMMSASAGARGVETLGVKGRLGDDFWWLWEWWLWSELPARAVVAVD
jgi:hypothetical protein